MDTLIRKKVSALKFKFSDGLELRVGEDWLFYIKDGVQWASHLKIGDQIYDSTGKPVRNVLTVEQDGETESIVRISDLPQQPPQVGN
jgi:hypothetical protein